MLCREGGGASAPAAAGMILYLILLTEFNDVFQFCWGKTFGRHKIIPWISPNKTWQGFLGGLGSTIVLALLLRDLASYFWWQALLAGLVIGHMGFFGDLTISAIKRDLGRKDTSKSIPGHGGFMDRLDSLSFASLAFFYLNFAWS